MILKVKLFVLAALILLSSINSIFNSIPIIGVSAQEYEEIDYGSTGINQMVENYLYEEPRAYNTDNGYSNEEAEYSSYDNYEYSSNNEYVQDDYSTYNQDSYENEYSDNSYDESYYPPKEPKKFTCPDSGIVVDKEENCPIVCPAGSSLEGHFVKAGSDLQKVCNERELQTCGTGTDLEGVKVSNAPGDCNIFATCNADTPLGRALNLPENGSVEVADPQLCQLNVPGQIETTTCGPESTNPIMVGAEVFDEELCDAATPAVQCTDGTFEGVWVHPDQEATVCALTIPPPVETTTCGPESTNPVMVGAEVTDERLCDAATPAVQCTDGTFEGVWVTPAQQATVCALTIPEFATCEDTTPLGQFFGQSVQVADIQLCNLVTQCGQDTNMAGAFVTDEALCEAPDDDNLCTVGDLVGAYVNDPTTDCDIPDEPIVTNFESQCLKCADLAALQGTPNSVPGQSAQVQASIDLIGDNAADANVFTICDDPATASSEFNSTITIGAGAGGTAQENRIEGAFDLCMDNAPEPSADVQVEPSSLQENSLTTNVKPEDEIPTFSNQMSPPLFSPPTIAQGVEGAENSSPTLAKIETLKQQWLDLLP